VVDAQGKIRYHMIGDINPNNWPQLEALYQQLVKESQTGVTR
jgi:hypothetical protein